MKVDVIKNAVFILAAVLSAAFISPCQSQGQQENAVLSVIHGRKSVRNYTGEAVGRDKLEILIKAAMAAPTAVDRRPWAFIAVTDKDTLTRLAEGLPYSKMIVPAGSAIVVCGLTQKALSGEAAGFWVQDCSAATENILLAAESLGLGAVWTGLYPLSERLEHVRKVLGIPADVIPLNVIAVGFPTGDDVAKDKFDPNNIHWDKW